VDKLYQIVIAFFCVGNVYFFYIVEPSCGMRLLVDNPYPANVENRVSF